MTLAMNPGSAAHYFVLQNSGVPEFCHHRLRKSETSDFRRVRGTP